MDNLLIGAISANYKVQDISRWVETSNWNDVDRALMLYNSNNNSDLLEYLHANNIEVICPDFNFFGEPLSTVSTNTGAHTLESSYNLVHNLRFLHISQYLDETNYTKVFTTDVKDVYFNKSPFDRTPEYGIIATGEVIKYNEDQWNMKHLITNLGIFGIELIDKEVFNVGVFGGGMKDVKNICKDIYLLSCGKPLVADQTSFNYLIREAYKDQTILTSINDQFAIHLHVVSTGQINFNLDELSNYTIVHQYDRIK